MYSYLPVPYQKWCSSDFSPEEQFGAWNTAARESSCRWGFSKPKSTLYNFTLEMSVLNNVRLLNYVADPCQGWLSRSDINLTSAAYYGFTIIYEGQQTYELSGNNIVIDKNHAILWDSTQPMEFLFGEGLKKITLLTPQHQLQKKCVCAQDFVGKPIDMQSGIGRVTADHLKSLVKNSQAGNFATEWNSVINLSQELIACCIEAQFPRVMTKSRREMLLSIKHYINNNLDDSGLGPNSLSEMFHISVRYLQMLFQDEGICASNYIMCKRLEQCQRELERSIFTKDKISDVAFRWGFTDLSSFSNAFRKRYGVSPREYRDGINNTMI